MSKTKSKTKTIVTDLVPQQVEVQARKDAIRLSKLAEITVVSTAEEEAVAYENLKDIKSALNTIENKRNEIVKPLNASLKTVNNMFKELSLPFKTADSMIRNKILVYRREQEELANKEMQRREKIQASHEAKGHQTNDLVEVEKDVAAETVTVKRWTYKIVNIDNVPRDYFEFSTTAVREAIRSGVRSIPGLKIYQEESLRV